MRPRYFKTLFAIILFVSSISIKAQQTVTDIDGNIYKTVNIGQQVWMAENLKTTHYSNGDIIGTTNPNNLDISSENSPKYQWAYNGEDSLVNIYGRLYTWYAASDSRNVCPTGWHLPTDAEWITLSNYLGGETLAQGKLKEVGTEHWENPNTDANNLSGFTALPGGNRWANGTFIGIGSFSHWWTATEDASYNSAAWRRILVSDNPASNFRGSADKQIGWAVRCIEDPIPDSAKYFGQTSPGDTPVQFASGIITGYIHGTVAISHLGDEIFWVINPSTERIMYSKFEKGIWINPSVADFVKDYLTSTNGNPAFSPDGEKLFFFSNRPGGKGAIDTWYVESNDSGWSKPNNVSEPYNSSDDELTPIFTYKGNAYCVRSNKNHEYNPICYNYSNGKFTDPVSMDIIPEYGPWWTLYVSPEEDYLIFASGADADLYIRFKEKEGQWGNPISMGNKINTLEWERFPVVSPDGKYLFFTRGGSDISNLFWVSTSIIDSLKSIASTTSLKETESTHIQIFPNPSSQSIQIKGIDIQLNEANYKLIDLNGKSIKQGKVNSETIDISELTKGIYMLSLQTNKGLITEKIVIE